MTTISICRNCGTDIKRASVDDDWEHAEEAPVESDCWNGDAGPEPDDVPTFLEGRYDRPKGRR